MKITNKLNLPEPIFRACQNDDYTKGDADYSATQLLRPSWMNYLSKKHNGEIEKDCSNMLWALQGKAMHLLLERNASKHDLIEQRFNWSFDGIVISGKIDRYRNKIIQDYKWASVWEYIYGLKKEKEYQLNIYKLLMELYGHEVNKLEAIFFFRDWSMSRSMFDKNYPKRQIVTIEVPKLNTDEIVDLLKKRLKENKNPIPCTKEEKWCRDEKWAVMKKGRKKAVKLFDNENDAIEFKAVDGAYYIEYRPGKNTRCLYYCDVAKFCEYKDK